MTTTYKDVSSAADLSADIKAIGMSVSLPARLMAEMSALSVRVAPA